MATTLAVALVTLKSFVSVVAIAIGALLAVLLHIPQIPAQAIAPTARD